jgi:hypothetical protein
MPERLSSRLPLLVLAVSLAIAFHRLLLGEVFFWGLPALQFYPWREYGFEMLRHGQLPLWNPYSGAGAPLIANYQSALFYPLNWLGFVLPLAWSMSVTAVLHLFIAGWGMWMFTGRLGILPLGRGTSALAFGMTGYLVARLGTYPTISTAAWIPWVLWAIEGVLSEGRRRNVGWLAMFASLQLLAGHAQTTWYSMVLAAFFTIWCVANQRLVVWQRVSLLVFALALALGVAAVQLLPTAELLIHSQRSDGVDLDFAMNFSYRPATTLNFLAPNVFGNPGDGTYILKDRGAFFEDAVYIGLIPLISAIAAIISWWWSKLRRLERPACFASVPLWLAALIIGFIFALGDNSPVFPYLYHNIPTFDLFQAPVRWHIWTVFALSVLSGIGVRAWGRGHWLFFGTRLAVAACMGATLLAFLSPRFLPPDLVNNEGVQVIVRAVILTGILGALAGLLTLRQPENPASRWYPWWSSVVLLVVASDLVCAALGLNPTVPPAFYDQLTPVNQSPLRTYWPPEAEDAVKFQTFLRFDDYRVASERWQDFRRSGLPNLNLLDQNYSLNSFDPLLVSHFATYLKLMEANPTQRDTLLQAAGVGAIYDAKGELRSLERTAAHAWLVASACWHPDEASVMQAMLNPEWNPHSQVHLIGEGDCPDVQPDAESAGEVTSMDDNGLINLRVEQDSWLVLPHTYYFGWGGTYGDSQPLTTVRANLAFSAVLVPAGTETVQLKYEPLWFWPGAIISALSLLVILLLFRTKIPTGTRKLAVKYSADRYIPDDFS